MTQAPAALALLLASSSLNFAMDAAKAALSVAALELLNRPLLSLARLPEDLPCACLQANGKLGQPKTMCILLPPFPAPFCWVLAGLAQQLAAMWPGLPH